MPIIISQKGVGSASVIEKSSFGKEHNLQEYIHEHPEVIPVYDIQEDKRLLVVAREFDTQSGPIDALAVDKDGDIYIIETKLYANADKRRVVAQALDYGASLWKHFTDFANFIMLLDQDAQSQWKMSFREKAKDSFGLNDEQVETMVASMRENLNEGNLKFVVLMDSMDERLKELITYINQKSQFDIYGVELEFYKHEQYEIVIPKLYGMEAKKDNPPLPRRQPLTDEGLMEQIRTHYPSKIAALVETLRSQLKSSGLTTRNCPSTIKYGLEIDGGFIELMSMTGTTFYISLSTQAVKVLGGERFVACKQKINSVVSAFFAPGVVSDPTKYNHLEPKYGILDGKVEAFVKAVNEIAETVRNALAEAS